MVAFSTTIIVSWESIAWYGDFPEGRNLQTDDEMLPAHFKVALSMGVRPL